MWSPGNIHALPTKEDRIYAQNAILALEIELEMAAVTLLQAQQRLDNLKSDILKRKAWIAPVRRVPAEILSMIFTQCAEEKWRAPLVIQGVCRLWREVALQTPEAWSFIPWIKKIHSRRVAVAIPRFVSRSGNTPQHILVPQFNEHRELFDRLKEKVICATYLHNLHGPLHSFPKLERLKVHWAVNLWRKAPLDISSILDGAPNLNTLSLLLHPRTQLTTMGDRTISNIERLELHVQNPFQVLQFIQACSIGLNTLILSYDGCRTNQQVTPATIHFPRLQSLYLHETVSTHYRDYPLVAFEGHAPNLVTYMERGQVESVRFDTTNAHHLSTGRIFGDSIDYSARPLLKLLELRSPCSFSALQYRNVFPQLETVIVTKEWPLEEIEELNEVLERREVWTKRHVQVSKGRPVVLDRFIYPGFKCGHGRSCHADWCKWLDKESVSSYGQGEDSLELEPDSD